MKKDINDSCPCHSEKKYRECCHPFHSGKPAPDARALMRSRYSAYALELADYINNTAIKKTPVDQLLEFSRTTDFDNLEIHDFVDGKDEATVTFTAHLKEKTFTEKSRFKKEGDKWYYVCGEISR